MLFTVRDKATADKVVSWVKDGRGVRLWKSHDLGAGRPDVITPGDVDEKPHWAYCSYHDIGLNDIEFDERHVMAIPPEWFPECRMCKGTGRRSYEALSLIRGQTVAETKREVGSWCEPVDEDHFVCTYCHGARHEVERFKIRVERKYWGGWEPVGGVKFGDGTWEPPRKVARMLKKLSAHYKRQDIKWDWGYAEEMSMAEVTFYYSAPVSLGDYSKQVQPIE